MEKERINIHLYQSPFQHESRILRITKSLSEKKYFDRILIMATYLKDLKEIEQLDEKRTVYRIRTLMNPTLGGFLRYLFLIEWTLRIIIKFRKYNIVIINPHSVPTLPIAWVFKKIFGSVIIYDTHEIETEQYPNHSIRKRISKFIEKTFINNIDYLIATSDGYSAWYEETYGIKNIAVVKNFSVKREKKPSDEILRKIFALKDDDILFIYQGIIAKGRGIEMLLDIFSSIPDGKHIVFMGFGPDVNIVKEFSSKYTNIHYHPAVKPEDVYKYVGSCDVGFCIIENIFLSYYYTLPNKMLECLNVGVPVIVSDFPDMKKCIEYEDCGWATEVNSDSVSKLILRLTVPEINRKKLNACTWSSYNTWESQERILFQVYDNLEKKLN